ncbi:MAG: hypothetical protein AAFU41_08575 [Pseudomonadota bacterium]
MSTKTYAALTGDLVKSRQADEATVTQAFTALQNAVIDFGKARKRQLRFARFRWDGWQVVVPAGDTLSAILFILARLRATVPELATRIAVGVGEVRIPSTNDLSEASGPALFTSGKLIEAISPKRRLTIAGDGIGQAEVAIMDLIEFMTSGWTPTQAEAVACALVANPRTHESIANELGITRQAVQSRLAGAGFAYLENAIYAFETHDFSSG